METAGDANAGQLSRLLQQRGAAIKEQSKILIFQARLRNPKALN
jgi:hypothetical protein